jgi:hypothetical protein
MRYRLVALLAVLGCLCTVAVALPFTALAGSPSHQHPNFDDSRYPHSYRTKGNPMHGVPADPSGNSGYYYLNVLAAGSTVHAQVWTSSGTWRIDFDPGFDHHPLYRRTITTPNEVTFTGAHAGQFIRVRFAHLSGPTQPDHASAYATDSCALVAPATATSTVPSSAPCSADSGSATSSAGAQTHK